MLPLGKSNLRRIYPFCRGATTVDDIVHSEFALALCIRQHVKANGLQSLWIKLETLRFLNRIVLAGMKTDFNPNYRTVVRRFRRTAAVITDSSPELGPKRALFNRNQRVDLGELFLQLRYNALTKNNSRRWQRDK